jgi:hypothetical protein
VDPADGHFYCVACWLVFHAANARLERASARSQPGRHVQGVSCAPGRAQHGRDVRSVSFALEQPQQMPLPGAHIGSCSVQNVFSAFGQHAQRARTRVHAQSAHVHGLDSDSDSDLVLLPIQIWMRVGFAGTV